MPSSSVGIGSFRNSQDWHKKLPKELNKALFEHVSALEETKDLITLPTGDKNVYFNNAAFGRAYNDVLKLSTQLRNYAEKYPDVFYDQLCLPLINHTYEVVEQFFGTEHVLLVPNCTFGMKSVLETLVREEGHKNAAYLSPLYGATQKLLKYFKSQGCIENVMEVSPGLIEEDPKVIVAELEAAYKLQKFSLLLCDETASQSGRILPLPAISRFCKKYGVQLIVDGTQSCHILVGDNKEVLDNVDYFVMSTHKWLGNVKTCGVVRYGKKAMPPAPPAISFGWDVINDKKSLLSQARARFLWQGMLDSYISYITLGRALEIFTLYGEEQLKKASYLLEKGITEVLHKQPKLAATSKQRVINMFDLDNSQFDPLSDITMIQNALQDYGIYISVKKYGQDCGSLTKESCQKSKKDKTYVRISCWSYNNARDFESLHYVLSNNLRLSTSTKDAFIQQFTFMFDLYEKLFSVLKTKAYFTRAERLRHHLIFYYGHTAVFYINKLVVSGYLQPSERIDARLESTLSVGVDEMSWDDLLEDNYDWSGLSDEELEDYLRNVQAYRQQVKTLILQLIELYPVENPISQTSIHWILLMGMEHEKIHLETSAVIIAQVPLEFLNDVHDFNYLTYFDHHDFSMKPEDVPENKLVSIPEGVVCMGKDNLEVDLFGWDNEFGREKRELKSFEASQMLVSNAEFLEFVKAGAYTESGRKWWSKEGWKYVTDLDVKEPRFWRNHSGYRSMLKEIPMPWNCPVEVNNLEAEAFCRWKSEQLGKEVRLISHEESFLMRQIARNQTSNDNLNAYASTTPVDMFGGYIDGEKVYDISGNVWRHSVSVLTVMDGFKIDPFYDDFTLPTIDGYHNHILGGAWISLGNESNLNARYGFRRHFYQFAGIRYVCSDNDYHKRVPKIFEGNQIGQKITEHYTEFTKSVPLSKKPIENWPCLFGQMASEFIDGERSPDTPLKIMVACGGAGRITLEILRACSNLDIDHTDRTANNLQVLQHLLEESCIQWHQQLEGKITEAMDYHLDETEANDRLLSKKNNKVSYWQADYKNLRPQLKGYDVIVADFRHKNAADEIQHISTRLKSGGLLILAGIDDPDTSKIMSKRHSLTVLQENFERIEMEEDADTQFAHIHSETRYKHQYAVSNFSLWRKIDKVDADASADAKLSSADDIDEVITYYEERAILESYAIFHYGSNLLSVENFPKKTAEISLAACEKYGVTVGSALDAGCGPGRAALELSSVFDHVTAYDYSHGFIDMLSKRIDIFGSKNVTAVHGDGHKQMELLRGQKFDLIHGSNLIDRMNCPKDWLLQSKKMLNPGGILVIVSPHTWETQYTPLENWIGGFKKDGENYFTTDGLKELLYPELVLLESHLIPLVMPDEDGTYQFTYSNCAVFGTKS